MGHMRTILTSAGVLVMMLSSCIQMSQQAAGPIPPPSPETLRRPIPPALESYYTLPRPVER
jgi:hypothetical protein